MKKSLERFEKSRLSITKFLHVDDVVDPQIIEGYMVVEKPRVNKPKYKQPGTIYGYKDGYPLYLTFELNEQGWIYKGVCKALENTNQL